MCVCVTLTNGNVICISHRAALANAPRYLHVDLVIMVTRGQRGSWVGEEGKQVEEEEEEGRDGRIKIK